jgi:hypothetical protein
LAAEPQVSVDPSAALVARIAIAHDCVPPPLFGAVSTEKRPAHFATALGSTHKASRSVATVVVAGPKYDVTVFPFGSPAVTLVVPSAVLSVQLSVAPTVATAGVPAGVTLSCRQVLAAIVGAIDAVQLFCVAPLTVQIVVDSMLAMLSAHELVPVAPNPVDSLKRATVHDVEAPGGTENDTATVQPVSAWRVDQNVVSVAWVVLPAVGPR